MQLVDGEELAADAEGDLQVAGMLQVTAVSGRVGRGNGAALPVESKDP